VSKSFNTKKSLALLGVVTLASILATPRFCLSSTLTAFTGDPVESSGARVLAIRLVETNMVPLSCLYWAGL